MLTKIVLKNKIKYNSYIEYIFIRFWFGCHKTSILYNLKKITRGISCFTLHTATFSCSLLTSGHFIYLYHFILFYFIYTGCPSWTDPKRFVSAPGTEPQIFGL